MENEHDVKGHAFLGDEDLLITVDDEVAALVVATLPLVVDDLVLAELGQMAELRAHHHRDLANRDLVFLENLLLRLDGPLTCLGVLFAKLQLQDFYGTEDLGLVGEATDAGRVREDGLVGAVALVKTRVLVDGGPAKDGQVDVNDLWKPVFYTTFCF